MTLPKTLETHENGRLVWDIAEAADDRKAEDIAILKVDQISYLADFFVVVTGFSRTQVRAIADSIEERLETKYNKLPLRLEGKSEGMWILQDYGEVIVHIFLPQEREFYNLEAFWGHAERIEFEPAVS
jgi:ribosome-associated protein